MARFAFVLSVFTVFSMVACYNNQIAECTATPYGTCTQVETCCTSTDCSFVVDGTTYACHGKDCDAAIADVEAYCSVNSSPTPHRDPVRAAVKTRALAESCRGLR